MPAFTPMGIQAVARGVPGFLGGLGQMQGAMDRTGGATDRFTAQVSRLNVGLSAGIGAALGTATVHVLGRIGSALQNAGAAALETIANFERLNLSLQTLVAQEFIASGAAGDMAHGLELAAPVARNLVRWIEKLAILSPFTSEGIRATFLQVKGYGFAADEAQRLTQALVDFVSGAGRTVVDAESIALALGQIRVRGRLAGEEIRQLVQKGVPAIEILARRFGKTTAVVQQMVEDGLVPANVAIQTIVEWFEQNFVGAAARQATSLTGLLASIKELGQISLRNLFGPMDEETGKVEGLAGVLQRLLAPAVEFLIADATQARIKAFGRLLGEQVAGGLERLGQIVGRINPQLVLGTVAFTGVVAAAGPLVLILKGIGLALGLLASPITLLILALGLLAAAWASDFGGMRDTLSTWAGFAVGILEMVAREAVRWGTGIVEAIATGITQAIDVVVQALNTLAGIIAYWLAPGSPPRLLPDLDKWGRESAAEWLKGWTTVDFRAFRDLAGAAAGLLRGLGARGKIDEEAVIPAILGTREAIAEALQELKRTGTISEATFARIREAAGAGGEEVEELVRRYARLAQVSEELAAINKELAGEERAQQQEEETRRAAELQSILADPRATAAQKTWAAAELRRLELLQKQRELEAEQTEAQEAFDVFKDRLTVEEETLNLIGQQNALLERLAKTVEGIGKALEKATNPLELQLKAIRLQQDELRDLKRMAQLRAILESDTATQAEKTAAALELQEINLRRALRAQEAAELGIDLTPLQDIEFTLEEIMGKAKTAKEALGGLGGSEGLGGLPPALEEAQGKLNETFAQIEADLLRLQETITTTKAKFTEGIDAAREKWGALKTTIGEIPTLIEERVLGPAERLRTMIGERWGEALDAFHGSWLGQGLTTLQQGETWLFRVISKTGELIGKLEFGLAKTAFEALKYGWENISLPVLRALRDFYNEHLLPLTSEFIGLLTDIRDIGAMAVQGAWRNLLQPALLALWGVIDISVNPVLKALTGWLDEHVNPAMGGVSQAANDLADMVKNTLKNAIQGAIDGFLKKFEEVLDSIAWAVDWLTARIEDLREMIKSLSVPDFLLGNSPSPFETSLRGIAAAMADVNRQLAASPLVGGPMAAPAALAPARIGGGRGGVVNVTLHVDRVGSDVDVDAMAYRVAQVIDQRMRGQWS